jgi:putative sporulation protein YyaC
MATLQNTVDEKKIKLNVNGMNKSNYLKVRSSIMSLLINSNKLDKEIIVLCIGTDKCTGDSYAPFVGMFLSSFDNLKGKCKVVGTIENPVHAKNLVSTLENIDQENSLIIAVDAGLGELNDIGNVLISKDKIYAGRAIGKNLPSVGDISLMGIVNINSDMAFITLQSTRLNTVFTMAETSAKGIAEAIEIICQYKEMKMNENEEKAKEKLMLSI